MRKIIAGVLLLISMVGPAAALILAPAPAPDLGVGVGGVLLAAGAVYLIKRCRR